MRALRILVAAGAANQRRSYGVSGHDMPRWLPALRSGDSVVDGAAHVLVQLPTLRATGGDGA